MLGHICLARVGLTAKLSEYSSRKSYPDMVISVKFWHTDLTQSDCLCTCSSWGLYLEYVDFKAWNFYWRVVLDTYRTRKTDYRIHDQRIKIMKWTKWINRTRLELNHIATYEAFFMPLPPTSYHFRALNN